MSESLRDQLASAFDKVENTAIEGDGKDVSADTTIPVPEAPASSKIVEAPRDDRARNADGTFAEKKVAIAEKIPAKIPSQPVAPVAPAAPVVKVTQRPSSWKKDHWEAWDKIALENPALASYLNQRETEFARGVSTYKQEWESARPLMEAMAPFMPLLQQHRIDPGQWIKNLGTAHQQLALCNASQKLQMFAKLAQDYGVPLQALVDETAQTEYLARGSNQPQLPPNALTREDAMKLWQEQFAATTSEQEVARFSAEKEKYPHFDEVRDTMAGLLQANLADDLESAYDAALRHPRHADLWNAISEQKRAQDEEQKRVLEASRVSKARGKAVSPASATPSGPTEEKPKGLRAQLESATDAVLGSGRV